MTILDGQVTIPESGTVVVVALTLILTEVLTTVAVAAEKFVTV